MSNLLPREWRANGKGEKERGASAGDGPHVAAVTAETANEKARQEAKNQAQ